MTLIAVYDGHGTFGLEASQQANDYIARAIKKNQDALMRMEFREDVEAFLYKTFMESHASLKKNRRDYNVSGTCAILVLVILDAVYICNCGDSRAVMSSINQAGQVEALELSIDHKPGRSDERLRVENSKGKIEPASGQKDGTLRVWQLEGEGPGIAVTRSIGDLLAHKIGVSEEPEISFKRLNNNDEFIVLASDGIWDVMTSAEVVGFIKRQKENKARAAHKLVEECVERWKKNNECEETDDDFKRDDISAVIAYLDFETDPATVQHKAILKEEKKHDNHDGKSSHKKKKKSKKNLSFAASVGDPKEDRA
eukprot:CAMPEP_0115046854 /NCGR_PEP_ID=MMETSP0216-20121206/48977_1 /TAXON_ID=223996 /ORGANISM="Protocruzia adherens, Strain Boccale" /LENGTH=310 /DNA_ID=CAMNT_0002429975 /DNA_START=224 /DNA_END=1156 /DNA_ORIENTATION=-